MNITPEMARAELAKRELAKRQQAAPQQIQQPKKSSALENIGTTATDLFMAAGNKIYNLPEEISSGAAQLRSNPARSAGEVLSGLLEGGKSLYNLPLDINAYLASKNVPVFKQTAPLAQKLRIGETGLQQAVMGQPQSGDELFQDIGGLAAIIATGKPIAKQLPPITTKGISKQIAKDKSTQLSIAKQEYNQLFDTAANQGITHAPPVNAATKNAKEIIKNSTGKFHNSYKDYLSNPTLENAHWAQSELGALKRHLESIQNKTGLTPSQIKTLKAADEAQKGIKQSMFSKNIFGASPELAEQYNLLSSKYKENVIPYTRLGDLADYEAGNMRAKTLVKKLKQDEEFATKLAKKYPGLMLHNEAIAKIGKYGIGIGATSIGYDELKKLLK